VVSVSTQDLARRQEYCGFDIRRFCRNACWRPSSSRPFFQKYSLETNPLLASSTGSGRLDQARRWRKWRLRNNGISRKTARPEPPVPARSGVGCGRALSKALGCTNPNPLGGVGDAAMNEDHGYGRVHLVVPMTSAWLAATAGWIR
jgi:hypothetical protein